MTNARSGSLFSYVDLEARVAVNHPLRSIRMIVNDVLAALSGEFEALYARLGRPSIPPERLLRALLLQAFYSIRSERQLMEQLDFNLLYRWFVGLGIDDGVWDATVFCKNRDRLLAGDVAQRFLDEVLAQARLRDLLSDDHFSVDGTLLEAWASMKSFRAKDANPDSAPPAAGRNAERGFHGETRSNATHASTTDPDARLMRKGRGKGAEGDRVLAGHGRHHVFGGVPFGAAGRLRHLRRDRQPVAVLHHHMAGVAELGPTKPTTPGISSPACAPCG